MYLTEIKAKTSLRGFDTSNMPIGNTVNHKPIYDHHSHFPVIFIENCVTVWLLCAHPLMTSIYFIVEDPTLMKTTVRHFIFMYRLMFIFRISISWKANFPHLSISFLGLCINAFGVFPGQHQREIKAKTSFSWVDTSNMPIAGTDFHIPIYSSELIMNPGFIWLLCI